MFLVIQATQKTIIKAENPFEFRSLYGNQIGCYMFDCPSSKKLQWTKINIMNVGHTNTNAFYLLSIFCTILASFINIAGYEEKRKG